MTAATEGDDPEVVELLRQLIRNACVNEGTAASGHEIRSADVLASVLAGPGLDVVRLAPPGLEHRASLVTRIQGSDPTAPVVAFVAHTDVVPAFADGWTHDPFGGELIGGEVWGRGAVDMLNQTAAMAVAVRRLADAGFRPRGTLLFLAVADEEVGSAHGVDWLLRAHPDDVRADLVFTEVGGIQANGFVWVSTEEKDGTATRITAHGTPGHGSTPFGADNAVVTAAEVVRRIAAFRPPARIGPTWKAYVDGQPVDAETRAGLTDPARVGEVLATLPHPDARLAHACTHTTFSPNVVDAAGKINIIPDRAVVEVDVRIAPGDTEDDVRRWLTHLFADLGDAVSVEVSGWIGDTSSPWNTPTWAAMQRVTRRIAGPVTLLPAPLAGRTDARHYRRLGVPAYGFGLLSRGLTGGEYWRRFHGRDERIDVESLALSSRLWEELARELLAGPTG
jgi:acetylornithine deacetylase/succinyl-diaminopimelate desuccinylase-like protein